MTSRKPTPPLKLTDAQAAYIAGLVDGEGSLSADKSKRNVYALKLTVTNTHRPVLIMLMELAGGSVRTARHAGGMLRPLHRYVVAGRRMEALLLRIMPYMIIKKHQADLIMEYVDTIGATNKRVSEEVVNHRTVIRERLSQAKHYSYPAEATITMDAPT